jgi:hypothetical protein
VIHEFDPYFNYRTTKFLAEEGFYSFHNWFDDRAWYPLGRIIGGNITHFCYLKFVFVIVVTLQCLKSMAGVNHPSNLAKDLPFSAKCNCQMLTTYEDCSNETCPRLGHMKISKPS